MGLGLRPGDGQQLVAQRAFLFGREFMAGCRSQIEYVDCALAISCDMGRMKLVTGSMDGMRQMRQQALAVAGIDLNHRGP